MPTALEFASQLARQAGEMLRQRFSLGGTLANLKPDHSFVTASDLAADQMISAAVRQHYPQDMILSEEMQTSSPAAAPAVWIIDPLDGTTNYSLGLHVWGVSIARLVDGWPDTAAIYFPIIDELYTAQRGKGAFINGQRTYTRQPGPGQPNGFLACCSRSHRRYKISIPYKTRIMGSTAYHLCLVARGPALLALEATPKIWDLAAAWLVIHEAGGTITTLDGSSPFPLLPASDYSRSSFPTLAAASAELAQVARSQIWPKNKH